MTLYHCHVRRRDATADIRWRNPLPPPRAGGRRREIGPRPDRSRRLHARVAAPRHAPVGLSYPVGFQFRALLGRQMRLTRSG